MTQDPSNPDLTKQLMNGGAWRDFCDRLKALGDTISGDAYPQDERGRAEGYRVLTGLLVNALHEHVNAGDPRHPVMVRNLESFSQWGAPNPDNYSLRSTIDSHYAYRVWGNLKHVREVIFSLMDGDMQLEKYGIFSEKSLGDLAIAENGDFEMWISREPHAGNWMPMHESACIFQVRFYLSDWAKDGASALHIERVGGEGEIAPPLDAKRVVHALEKTIHWVEQSVAYWNAYSNTILPAGEKNLFVPAKLMSGGAKNILYGYCKWVLAPNQALLVVCEPPEAAYWSFCNYSLHWLEARDVANRQVSLSDHQLHVDDDGLVRLVLSAVDPGVSNWLDTQGYAEGLLLYRWVWARTNPVPQGELIHLDELPAKMPLSHPRVDVAERRRRLSVRREQYWNRYL